jgi:membrane protein implicated in regulation of membrane protease activity
MSAFYLVAYGALSLPAVLAGVLVTPLGLVTTFEVFGSVVAALALAVAWQAWRTRTRPRPEAARAAALAIDRA